MLSVNESGKKAGVSLNVNTSVGRMFAAFRSKQQVDAVFSFSTNVNSCFFSLSHSIHRITVYYYALKRNEEICVFFLPFVVVFPKPDRVIPLAPILPPAPCSRRCCSSWSSFRPSCSKQNQNFSSGFKIKLGWMPLKKIELFPNHTTLGPHSVLDDDAESSWCLPFFFSRKSLASVLVNKQPNKRFAK